jgi:hypothetical protein
MAFYENMNRLSVITDDVDTDCIVRKSHDPIHAETIIHDDVNHLRPIVLSEVAISHSSSKTTPTHDMLHNSGDDAFIISQFSDSEIDNDEDYQNDQDILGFNHSHTKRTIKYCNDYNRPPKRNRLDKYFSSYSNYNNGGLVTPTKNSNPCITTNKLEERNKEWWKQKPKSTTTLKQHKVHESQSCYKNSIIQKCFVCESFQQQNVSKKDGKKQHSSSLLSYFNTTSNLRSSSSSHHPQYKLIPNHNVGSHELAPKAKTYHPCSYCEHYSCSGCTKQCEQCNGSFCSFCCTTDYSEPRERIFCLDCHGVMMASQKKIVDNDGDVIMS